MSDESPGKWDYIYYAMIAGTIFFFGMALVGFVGELLGWWNDVGEWLMRSGSIGGLVLAAVTLVVGASRSQVSKAREAIGSTKDAVDSTKDAVETNGDKLDEANATLDGVDDRLAEQTRVLEQIRDRV